MDPVKAQSNRRKHGLTFENGVRVFADPHAISEQERIEDGEIRWQLIGLFEAKSLLTVAYTILEEWPDEIFRIISVRKATRKERRLYEQNRPKDF
ncbi:MAG: BrnT family toxin [Acidobacteriaceae bacterium]